MDVPTPDPPTVPEGLPAAPQPSPPTGLSGTSISGGSGNVLMFGLLTLGLGVVFVAFVLNRRRRAYRDLRMEMMMENNADPEDGEVELPGLL